MSYILDALKKIEHEKNKKKRPDGRISISGDLFYEQKQPPARGGIWKIIMLVAAASLVTGLGTWFALHGSGKKSTAVILPAASPPPAPIKPPAVSPLIPAPAQSQTPPVAVTPAAPSAAVPVTPISREKTTDEDEDDDGSHRSKKRTKELFPSAKQSAQSVRLPADIKLSGIAWQEERKARRAVVNGFLLREGASVSGVRITEIQTDRVRFSSPDGSFEIKLDAVLPVEVQR